MVTDNKQKRADGIFHYPVGLEITFTFLWAEIKPAGFDGYLVSLLLFS
jgi:hypothetical protein